MKQNSPKKKEKKDSIEKVINDYKKTISGLRDKQKQLIIEGKLKGQIED